MGENLFKFWFYHGHIRNVTLAMMSIFRDVTVARIQGDGTIHDIVKPVPIDFLTKESPLLRITKIPHDEMEDDFDRFIEFFPRMTLEFTGMDYAPDRGVSRRQVFKKTPDDALTKEMMAAPVPYNFNFTLHIGGRSQTDVFQIVEQILPRFRPYISVSIKDYPVDGKIHDIIVNLQGVDIEENRWADLHENTPLTIWSLSFMAQSHLYSHGGTQAEVDVNAITNPGEQIPPLDDMIDKVIIRRYVDYEDFVDEDDSDEDIAEQDEFDG
jgi:hypothetical protein